MYVRRENTSGKRNAEEILAAEDVSTLDSNRCVPGLFQTSNDSHVYECLSSSPECDSSLELRHGVASHLSSKRKSDSNAMEAGAEFKFHQQTFARSTSLPYCGSETESELYAPYGFYTGDEVRFLGIPTGNGRDGARAKYCGLPVDSLPRVAPEARPNSDRECEKTRALLNNKVTRYFNSAERYSRNELWTWLKVGPPTTNRATPTVPWSW